MSRALAIEARRGVGPATGVLVVAVLVAGLLAHQRDWVGDWTGSSYYLRFLVVLAGPVVVAAAAWQGGRGQRRGLQELLDSTSRDPLRRTLVAWSSPALWGGAAYLLVVAAAAAVTATRTSYGLPLLGVLTSGLAVLLALAAVGYGIGQLLPWRLTAPVLALSTYVLITVLSFRQDGLRFLSPAIEPNGLYYLLPVRWWAGASTALYLALAVAALLLTAHHRRTGALALAVAVTAAVPLARAGDRAFVPDRDAAAVVCADGNAIDVCLTRRHADQLATVTQLANTVLGGLQTPPSIVEGYSRDSRVERTGPGVTVGLNELYLGPTLTGGPDLAVLRQDLAGAMTTWGCDPFTDPMPEDLYGPAFRIQQWLAARTGTADPGLGSATHLHTLAAINDYRLAAGRCDAAGARRAAAVLS